MHSLQGGAKNVDHCTMLVKRVARVVTFKCSGLSIYDFVINLLTSLAVNDYFNSLLAFGDVVRIEYGKTSFESPCSYCQSLVNHYSLTKHKDSSAAMLHQISGLFGIDL